MSKASWQDGKWFFHKSVNNFLSSINARSLASSETTHSVNNFFESKGIHSNPLSSTQVVRSTGKSECPICLGSPAAGRVGHCGHVHCWPCALHYAAAHEKQPPPCPVCAAPFRVEQMKPARILQWEPSNDEVSGIVQKITVEKQLQLCLFAL